MRLSQPKATLIATALIQLAAGATSLWGATSLYYLSYFRTLDPDLPSITASLILLAVVIPVGAALMGSTALCKHLGHSGAVRVCAVAFAVSQTVVWVDFSLFVVVVFGLAIPACCLAVSLVPTLHLLWSSFLSQKSLCTALNLVFLGAGSILWSLLFLHIVNPNNSAAHILPSGEAVFPAEVSDNLPTTHNLVIGMVSCMFVSGALLLRDPSPEKEEKTANNVQGEEMKDIDMIKEDAMFDVGVVASGHL